VTKSEKNDNKIRRNPDNVNFKDFITWIEDHGYKLDRINGSHHIFVHPDIDTPVNAQKKRDGTAKAYQVKQAIKFIDGE